MLAKKTSKNQLTLPKDIVTSFPDTEYFDVSIERGRIILMPVTICPEGVASQSIRDKMRSLGLTEKDVTDAVKWARKNKKP